MELLAGSETCTGQQRGGGEGAEPPVMPQLLPGAPGWTRCAGSAGPINAVDSCNQLQRLGTRWDKHTLSITQCPGPASTREHCQAQPAWGCIILARNDTLHCLLLKCSPNPA